MDKVVLDNNIKEDLLVCSLLMNKCSNHNMVKIKEIMSNPAHIMVMLGMDTKVMVREGEVISKVKVKVVQDLVVEVVRVMAKTFLEEEVNHKVMVKEVQDKGMVKAVQVAEVNHKGMVKAFQDKGMVEAVQVAEVSHKVMVKAVQVKDMAKAVQGAEVNHKVMVKVVQGEEVNHKVMAKAVQDLAAEVVRDMAKTFQVEEVSHMAMVKALQGKLGKTSMIQEVRELLQMVQTMGMWVMTIPVQEQQQTRAEKKVIGKERLMQRGNFSLTNHMSTREVFLDLSVNQISQAKNHSQMFQKSLAMKFSEKDLYLTTKLT